MKNKRMSLWLLTLCFAGIYGQQPAEKYDFTLEEAVQFALDNNRTSKNAALDIEAAKKQKWETTTMGLPKIDGKIDYQRFLKQQVTLMPAEFFGGQPGEFIDAVFGTKQNASASATLSQLIFDGSYLVGLQSAKVYLQISNLLKEKNDVDLRKTVVDAYANVLLAEETIKILQENKSVLQKNLNETQAMFDNGLGEEESVEQLQITLANINNNLNNTIRLHDLSKKMLNITLGLSLDDAVTLTDRLDALAQASVAQSIANDTDFNIENNIDYRIASNNLRSQELLLKYEKSQSLPKLNAFINGAYNAYNDEFTFLQRNQRWFGSSLVGVSLDIPIFSSGMRSSRVQRFRIELDKSKNDFDQAKQQLRLAHSQALSNLQFAVEENQTFKENLELAKRIEQKNQIKFTEGLATSFDLRQAQLQLYSAQQDYLQSMVNVLNKKEELNALQNK
ncbi:MAG: TolC family protein [Capnocytophaga sp.]|nr:TolC family protein [Capnocytophaga sp.]